MKERHLQKLWVAWKGNEQQQQEEEHQQITQQQDLGLV